MSKPLTPDEQIDQEYIISRRKELLRLRAPLQEELAGINARLQQLKKQCKHPRATSSYDADFGYEIHCPDCGKGKE